MNEHNTDYLPSYCFNWGDPSEVAGHKQSGDINNPDNFENHKIASGDYAKRPLYGISAKELHDFYKPYYHWIIDNPNQINQMYKGRYFR